MLIEVVYAGPAGALLRTYRLEESASVADALRLAAADPTFAGVDFTRCGVGIFGVLHDAQHALQDGDRIELVRELAVDPKSARRRRAAAVRRQSAAQ